MQESMRPGGAGPGAVRHGTVGFQIAREYAVRLGEARTGTAQCGKVLNCRRA